MESADGTRLAVRRHGRGEPLVLVHGSAGGLDSWDPVLPLLTEEFQTWVYARRGYAPSDGCTRAKTFADDVADLRAVIMAAGGEARVVGGSYGATVGLHAALADGAGIRTLTVFEPPLFAAADTVALDRYRAALTGGDLLAANRIFAADVARFPMDVGAAAPDEAAGMLHDLEALAADSADVARWAGIGVPVRIVQGATTWEPMPATMDALGVALPKASRVVLAGQSHFASHTAPQAFAEALRW
ncbi:Pimeloyl-ACP methyl ester carboxylesterase [Actinoplanes derwentensis]|uniref:Pimeloyl-ACP methyl ester carboxylesterase n=1 Tax=Actinoplanes derwentensis TaxID=113562 RepID=A0A1H2AG55_9ACTN|nr:Pimeloyl-ACP methyl ester carboxylesterase [Actinoplanes derwentensis]